MKDEIRGRCRKILAENMEITEEELCEKYLEESLEMDSLAMFEFVVGIEDAFEIEYHDFGELTMHMNNLDELLDYLTELIGEKE